MIRQTAIRTVCPGAGLALAVVAAPGTWWATACAIILSAALLSGLGGLAGEALAQSDPGDRPHPDPRVG